MAPAFIAYGTNTRFAEHALYAWYPPLHHKYATCWHVLLTYLPSWCTPLVVSRQSCPRGRPHMPYACLPAFSQSHVMCHNSARADEATRIPTSQWQSPDPTPSPRHVRAPYSYSMSVHITPRQRLLIPPHASQSERTCDARSSRTSHVATSFPASCPFLTHSSFYACKRLLSACKVRRAARAEPMSPSINGPWPSGSVAEL